MSLWRANALAISSNDNTLSHLTLRGAPRDGLHLLGSRNHVFTGTILLTASRYGLYVDDAQAIRVTAILVGTPSAVVGACGQGNCQGGMVLANITVSSTLT